MINEWFYLESYDVFVKTGMCQSYNCGANRNQKKKSVFSKGNIEECECVT